MTNHLRTYHCMTPEELALWTEAAMADFRRYGQGARTPCTDCPIEFRRVEVDAGRCIQRQRKPRVAA